MNKSYFEPDFISAILLDNLVQNLNIESDITLNDYIDGITSNILDLDRDIIESDITFKKPLEQNIKNQVVIALNKLKNY